MKKNRKKGGEQGGKEVGMKSLGSVIGKRWFTIIGFPSLIESERKKEATEETEIEKKIYSTCSLVYSKFWKVNC